jgi:hypothetical protein
MPLNIGSAKNYAIVSKSSVSNTNASTVIGNIGIYPGNTITGYNNITLTGSLVYGTGLTNNAKNIMKDVKNAYNDALLLKVKSNFTNNVLGQGDTTIINPGVYKFDKNTQIIGNLRLINKGIYIFIIDGSLTVAPSATVTIENGAVEQNVNWIVRDKVYVSASAQMVGNIISKSNIELKNGAGVHGRTLTQGNTVSLDGNIVNNIYLGYV